MFLSCRPFVVITTFSTSLGPSQETEVALKPTRPVENVITTKGLQDRNNLLLDGWTVENKGKLINQATQVFETALFLWEIKRIGAEHPDKIRKLCI